MPFYLYNASAGSGKTYILVKEYLRILFDNPENLKNIVAMTFTNKAAAEMKNRVIINLKKIIDDENSNLINEFINNYKDKNYIRSNAKIILEKILHNYSDFKILTIDSFINKIIRSFSLELGYPINYDINLELENIISDVIDELFELSGQDNYLTNTLIDYIYKKISSNESFYIENDIFKFSKSFFSERTYILFNESSRISNTELDFFINYINKFIQNFKNYMKQKGEEALRHIEEFGLKKEDFAYKGEGNYSYFEKIIEGDKDEDYLIKSRINKNKWYLEDETPENIKIKIESLRQNYLDNLINNIRQYLEANFTNYCTYRIIQENILFLKLIEEINELYNKYKIENNIIPIHEFSLKLEELIKKNDIPFIYLITGENIHHYLIDEFQDTSKLQWENLFPLIDNSLAYNYFSMAVGDAKQAIYRWRNGDVNIILNDIKQKIPNLIQLNLNKNYRSAKNIVEFNNKFFSNIILDLNLPDSSDISPIYKDIEQITIHNDIEGYVCINFVEKESKDNKNNNNNVKEMNESDDSYEDLISKKVVNIIKDLINKNYQYKDIAILVRQNSDADPIFKKLLENNIPVISTENIILSKNILIQFIINFINFLLNPFDERLEKILYFLYNSLYKEEYRLSFNQLNNIILNLDKNDNTINLVKKINELLQKREYFISLPLYEMIEEIIRIGELNSNDKLDNNIYLQQFLSVILDYTTKNKKSSLIDFMNWYNENSENLKIIPSNYNSIQILTIHKSKGLQFPIVIIPFADWKIKSNEKNIEWYKCEVQINDNERKETLLPINFKKGLKYTSFDNEYNEELKKIYLDNLNLLYVAFTRAKFQLYIITQKEKVVEKKKKTNENNNEEISYVSQIINKILKKKFNFESDYFELGDFSQNNTENNEVSENEFIIDEFISTRWDNRITIKRISDNLWKLYDEEKTKKIDKGNLIHELLSEINKKEDIEKVINKNQKFILFNEEEKNEIIVTLNNLIDLLIENNCLPKDYIIKNECSIITKDEIIRPDKVLIKNDSAIIIEYKTGEKNTSHKRQIEKYANYIKEMGYKNINAYLVYLDNMEINKVL